MNERLAPPVRNFTIRTGMRRLLTAAAIVPAFLMAWSLAAREQSAKNPTPAEIAAYQSYKKVVDNTAGMVANSQLQQMAKKFGLQVMNLTWEDTARFQNSAVGPNISDMTIQVQQRDPRTGKFELRCMPVIRYPNFTDKTGDIDASKFQLLVGNEKGQKLRRVSLMNFLGNIRRYLHNPNSWKSDKTFLHANRDSHVLVSAQACFLPVPKKGVAEFNPVLFNYQSMKEDPAVMTILVTREGTSVTVIDNVRDGFHSRVGVWGQRLFFNKNGQRCSLTATRLSDVTSGGGKKIDGGPKVNAAGQDGMNMVLLIQVPLKQRNPMRFNSGLQMESGGLVKCSPFPKFDRNSDVENAVIGHGKVEGKFTEIDNLPIERDHRYPIRVTVQFYKATSNGMVSEKDMADIAAQIQKVYKKADYVGSLVVDGTTDRPTEYDGDKVQPPDWWQQFWKRYEQNTGYTRQQAIEYLRKHHGKNWRPVTEQALANDAAKIVPRQVGGNRRPNGANGVESFRVTPAIVTWPLAGFAGCLVIGGLLIGVRAVRG